MGFKALTEEERARLVAQARVAQTAKQAARKASKLRRDFLDADLWADLARARGLRLPPWGEPATVSNMRTWLNKVGGSQGQYERWAGCKLAAFIAQNPTWPARALAGVILEEEQTETEETWTRTTE